MAGLKVRLGCIGLIVVLGGLVGCTGGSSDNDKAGEATPSPSQDGCDESLKGLEAVDDGWSALDGSGPGYAQVAYGFIVENTRTTEILESATIEVSFLDENGDPVIDGGTQDDPQEAPNDTRVVMDVLPGGRTAITGRSPLGEEPAKVELTVTAQCFVAADEDEPGEMSVSEQDVSLDGSQLSLSLRVNSSFAEEKQALILVIFRDSDGNLVAGAPNWALAPAEWPFQWVKPGNRTVSAEFEVGPYLPSTADIAQTEVFVKEIEA